MIPVNSAQIRQNNIRTLLLAIRDHGPIPKRDLQEITGLSWGSVSTLVGELENHAYIVQTGKQSSNYGRKADEFDINHCDNYIIGIDLNISGIYIVVTDMKGKTVQKWFKHMIRLDYDSVLDTLFQSVDQVINEAFAHKAIMGIGIAVQGVVDIKKGISIFFPHIKKWKNVNLKQIFENRYNIETYIMHDPNCIMTAERHYDPGNLCTSWNAALVRIDRGIGMSIFLNNHLFIGSKGKQGEIGHIPVVENGALCTCGNRGCLEQYASTDGIVQRFFEEINRGTKTQVDLSDYSMIDSYTLMKAAIAGDPLSRSLFSNMGRYLGLALSTVVNILDVDRVIIYGEFPHKAQSLILDLMIEEMNSHIYAGSAVDVRFSELGADAAAIGAAINTSEILIKKLIIS